MFSSSPGGRRVAVALLLSLAALLLVEHVTAGTWSRSHESLDPRRSDYTYDHVPRPVPKPTMDFADAFSGDEDRHVERHIERHDERRHVEEPVVVETNESDEELIDLDEHVPAPPIPMPTPPPPTMPPPPPPIYRNREIPHPIHWHGPREEGRANEKAGDDGDEDEDEDDDDEEADMHHRMVLPPIQPVPGSASVDSIDDEDNMAEDEPSSSASALKKGKRVDHTGQPELPRRRVTVESPTFSRLVFEDAFDTLDLATWQHEITAGGGGNWEFQYYTNNRSNTFVSDGVLYVKPTLTADRFGPDLLSAAVTLDLGGSQPPDACTGLGFYGCLRLGGAGGNVINPVQSARIRTAHSFSFKYGRMEVKAKMPRGDWLWPAIWLMPRTNAYGDWPASGEVDVVESRGNDGFNNQIGSTLHVGPYVQANDFRRYHHTKTLANGDFTQAFHIYGIVWTPDFFYMYVDKDDEAHRVMVTKFEESAYKRGGWLDRKFDNPWRGRNYSAPFDQEFYIAMNVAVGGTNGYFADSMPRKPWTNADRNAITAFWNAHAQWVPSWTQAGDDVALQVDWIRVYQLDEKANALKPPHERHTHTHMHV